MVPRRGPEPRVAALALPLPPARVPLRASWSARTRRRGKLEPEFELLDTGVFDDDRYWIVEVDYAKADPHDMLHPDPRDQRRPRDRDAPRAADRCGSATPGRGAPEAAEPRLRRRPGRARSSPSTRALGGSRFARRARARRRRPARCSARTRPTRRGCSASRRPTPYPKDGINDHVIHGAATVNPERTRHEGGLLVPARGRRRARPSSSGCGSAPASAAADRRRASAPPSTRC